ncbi:hypothetical protein [Halorarius litoreus]|uniref:hypothetical protein n=1 Tax=Halorarius litoreus TaxID=2962676 RepID=UPI0020CE4965|nr:hypothetical protein [Halorarius litoreus]
MVVASALVSVLVAVFDAYGTFDLAELACTPVARTPEGRSRSTCSSRDGATRL